jgi:hypothetical protein
VFDVTFEGFSPAAFALLERLRQHPHIEQYRKEKTELKEVVQEPFKRYRDDLVVNWVLPNALGFETERNVFSRILKNDFGAGGCNHHLWMSFYRPGRRRLTDLQLAHSISPHGFTVGLFVGSNAKRLLRQVRQQTIVHERAFLGYVNSLLARPFWTLAVVKPGGERIATKEPVDALPEGVRRADSIWLRYYFERERVLEAGPRLIEESIGILFDLWPVYRLWAGESIA